MKGSICIAVAQMCSGSSLEANLEKMQNWTKEAAHRGAKAIFFPELCYYTGNSAQSLSIAARYNECMETFSSWAREYRLIVVPGSIREPSSDEKFLNTLPVIDENGKTLAAYRKIFLFKANLPDRHYDESDVCAAGSKIVVTDTAIGKLGLSICYDLRFPELYRALRHLGAEIFLAPSAFTVPTGEAHWHTLVRARAIENQCFMIAPGQTGINGDGAAKFGHSLVVSPWGEVLSDQKSEESLALVHLDREFVESARARVDAWSSRRNDLFS